MRFLRLIRCCTWGAYLRLIAPDGVAVCGGSAAPTATFLLAAPECWRSWVGWAVGLSRRQDGRTLTSWVRGPWAYREDQPTAPRTRRKRQPHPALRVEGGGTPFVFGG